MFIKRDLRKIQEILNDVNTNKETLIFSKRQSEFQGSIKLLLQESKLPLYGDLKVLNLYDNSLTTIQGIHLIGQQKIDNDENLDNDIRNISQLEELNLGCNHLKSLPLEVSYSILIQQYS